MKLKILVVGVVTASLSVSAAVAAPPPGKGKPETAGQGKPATTGLACRPKVTVVLKGTVAGATASTLSLDVKQTNRWGRAYDETTTAVNVDDETTKVRRNGNKATLADLVVGEWVLVQARACKADLADDAMPALTAVRVVAHPAKA